MTEKLREALHETAELGRTATVPDTLWADAQRARRRDRVILPIVALVLIACAGAVLGVLTQPRHEAGPADGSDLAVPSRIWGITSDSENGGWGYEGLPPAADDFNVGTAAALVLGESWAVVSAEDGSYHRFTDRGWGSSRDDRPALTTQGDRIAWSLGARKGGVLRISVADLTTGDVRRYPVREAQVPAGTRDLTWSASGRYLAFRTSERRETDRGRSRSLFRLYVLDTTTGEVNSRTAWGDTVVPLAATEDGEVTIIWKDAVRTWMPGHGQRVGSTTPGPASSMAISPDGSVLAMSLLGLSGEGTEWPPDVYLVATGADGAEISHKLFVGRTQGEVLGWTRSGQVVALVGDDDTPHTGELTLIDGQTLAPRVVGTIDTHDLEQVQVATALMTSDRPTVDRDEPSWVDHDFPWWRAFGISLVLGLLLLAVLNVRRRRMAG